MKKILLFVSAVLLFGCSTVTPQPQRGAKLITEPSHQKSHDFFLFGFVGEKTVDVKNICSDQSVRQMQSQQTILDSALSLITFGIYTPRTVKVWCGKARG